MRNNYIKKTLKNGVKLYLYIDKNMTQTYVDYMVDYGHNGKFFKFYYQDKLYEVLPGCAHFLEHMLGEHSKYGNIYKYFTTKKYQRNATTSIDVTHYYFLGVEDIKDSIEKLINVVDNPVFTKEDVLETKPAIIEETKRGLNNAEAISSNLSRYNLYKDLDILDSSLSYIGNEETTKSLDYETLKLCYDAFYYDENKTLLIAGNFDEDDMTEYVESVYDGLKPHKKEVRLYEYRLDKKKKEKEIRYMATNDDLVSISFKQCNNGFSKKEIVYFLGYLYGIKYGADKEFTKELKRDNIITSMDGCNHLNISDNDFFITIYCTAKNSDEAISKIIEKIKLNDFDEKDFELYFRVQLAHNILVYDNKYQELMRFVYNKYYTDDFNDIDFIKNITFTRFMEFYNSLKFDDYSIGLVRDSKLANNS
ncbi:MAG: insulinase family protein [Bacilli bacterium]|nr:insulinase family protein [Bacilli bacterium]